MQPQFTRRGKTVAKTFVNMDALIPREFFEETKDSSPTASSPRNSISATELEIGHLTYNALRKPEFQRETADWEPKKVAELISSCISQDMIPSLILWQSATGNIFVIDGAHRLSAVIAWVNNDYGDGNLSRAFFQDSISKEQKRAAQETRDLIKSQIGSFAELRDAARYPKTASDEIAKLAKKTGFAALPVQWVTGNSKSAEAAYFRINQGAAAIGQTEMSMINSRQKANALAARALIHAGTGHKYWSKFSKAIQDDIEGIAHDITENIFKPEANDPIRSLDQPVAGHGYGPENIKMIFELVNYVNDVPSEMWGTATSANNKKQLPDDVDGSLTSKFLSEVKKATSRIAGNDPSSLGLHPFVYFYGATGRFQPTAFLAAIAFVAELAKAGELPRFTKARAKFEEFLLRHRLFTNQIGRAYGARQRGLPPTLTMYRIILAEVEKDTDDAGIVERLRQNKQLTFLSDITEADKKQGKNFARSTKTAVIIRESMQKALYCPICNARMPFKSIIVDHKVRREDKGSGTAENAQLTHPYCGSGQKEREHAKATGA